MACSSGIIIIVILTDIISFVVTYRAVVPLSLWKK